MFNYPLILSKNNFYYLLKLTPVATSEEIRTAINDAKSKAEGEKQIIEKELNKVYKEIPELNNILREIENLHSVQNNKDIHKADDRLADLLRTKKELEKRAIKIVPHFNDLVKEKEKINIRLTSISNYDAQLLTLTKRKEYDDKHAMCPLLKLEKDIPLVFSDNEVQLFFLRKEIADFFEDKTGAPIFHPSDLTRKNFESDFNYNSILDQ